MGSARSIHELSVAQLERLIRELAAVTVQVRFTAHAEQRMRLRRILRAEVLEVLQRGRIVAAPEPNPRYGTLECRMQRFLAGRDIAAVAALSDDDPSVVVVTVILL